MKSIPKLSYFIFFFFVFCLFSNSFDVCVYKHGSDASVAIMELHDTGCIGGADDSIAKPILDILDQSVPPGSPERLEIGLTAIQEIRKTLGKELSIYELNELEKRLVQSLYLVEAELNGSSRQRVLTKPRIWEIDQDELKINLSQDISFDFMGTYLESECQIPDSLDCAKNFDRAIITIRTTELVFRTLDYLYRDDELGGVLEQAKLRNNQWDQYFKEGYPQWPWELLVNGRFYMDKVLETPGLAEPPDWQFVYLHPDIALEYVDAADEGDRFKPALMVEIIGADLWTWDKNSGKQTGPWGLPFAFGTGIVGTFSDRSGTDNWSLGLLFRVNHSYNFGITTRDGDDIGIFISFNLGKLITKPEAQKEAWFKIK